MVFRKHGVTGGEFSGNEIRKYKTSDDEPGINLITMYSNRLT